MRLVNLRAAVLAVGLVFVGLGVIVQDFLLLLVGAVAVCAAILVPRE